MVDENGEPLVVYHGTDLYRDKKKFYEINRGFFDSSKEVARSKFYNVQGIETAQPQKGVNIQVMEYTDGSKKTVKILK